jgi:hypothetical protein
MADRDHTTANPLALTANSQRTLPEGTSAVISFGPCSLPPPCVHPVSLP